MYLLGSKQTVCAKFQHYRSLLQCTISRNTNSSSGTNYSVSLIPIRATLLLRLLQVDVLNSEIGKRLQCCDALSVDSGRNLNVVLQWRDSQEDEMHCDASLWMIAHLIGIPANDQDSLIRFMASDLPSRGALNCRDGRQPFLQFSCKGHESLFGALLDLAEGELGNGCIEGLIGRADRVDKLDRWRAGCDSLAQFNELLELGGGVSGLSLLVRFPD